MAFISKSGNTYRVRHGTSGEILASFSGSDAQMQAETKLRSLHQKFNPKTANRGKSALERYKKS